MTLDALSLATLTDVKRGGCCGRAFDSFISPVQVGKARSLYVGVPGESDHTLCWSLSCQGGGPGQTVVMVTPKDLLVTCVRLTTRVLRNIA